MRRFPAIVAAGAMLAFSVPAEAKGGRGFSYGTGSSGQSHYVAPHTTRSGNLVGGHYRTNPDSGRSNNYGSYGNSNPYTGGMGNGYGASR